jgi:hypothetical protein
VVVDDPFQADSFQSCSSYPLYLSQSIHPPIASPSFSDQRGRKRREMEEQTAEFKKE